MPMSNAINDGTCYGHVIDNILGPKKNRGKVSKHKSHAVQACEKAHGPRPRGYVCRHLCVNDSSVGKRGEDSFVCIHPDHIEWSTQSQNILDAGHNISAALKGKPMSEEQKQKMSATNKGKKRGPYKPRKLKEV